MVVVRGGGGEGGANSRAVKRSSLVGYHESLIDCRRSWKGLWGYGGSINSLLVVAFLLSVLLTALRREREDDVCARIHDL